MDFTVLIDRTAEQERLQTALQRESPQFIVVYGRRRIGKSTLIKKHILIGECKWTGEENAERLLKQLESKTASLPFVKKGQQVHLALFLREKPVNNNHKLIFLPKDVLCSFRKV